MNKEITGRPNLLRYLLALPVFVLGVASILALSCTDVTSPSSDYFYANWDCKNQQQCIAVMGLNLGSAGPFCTKSPCDKWRITYFYGATCDLAPAHNPIGNAPPAGTCQS